MTHHPHGRTIRPVVSHCVGLVLPLLVVGAAGTAGAQTGTARDLRAGDRVRVHVMPMRDDSSAAPGASGSRSLTGELRRLDADSVVVLTSAGYVASPRASVVRVAVNMGKRPLGGAMWRGAAIGTGIGAVVGAVSGYASYEVCGPADFLCPSRGGTTALGAISGGLAGALIGGVIGAVARRDRWAHVTLSPDLRVGLGPAPRGIGLAVAF